jgi:FlaA1/EpsC-like NDP-sugar epimerase
MSPPPLPAPAAAKPDPAALREVSQWQRTTLLVLIYAGIIAASFYLAYEIRFDFQVADELERERLRLIGMILLVKLFALYLARQFGTLMTYFSLPDLFRLAWAMGGASLVLLLPRLLVYKPLAVPRGVLLIDFLLCFGALCAGRLAARLFRERTSGAARAARGLQPQIQRIAIVGAGDAGASLAKEFIGAPQRGFEPVMFFDDDRTKHGKLVHGVPVVGRPEDIGRINDAATLAKAIIAMPSAPARRVQEVVKLFAQQGLKVETLPSIEELASGRVLTSRIRPVEVQDLLGREAVELDSAGIRLSLAKRVVMVTGAGGSIGSELCRQIAAVNPARLLLVEQSEAALFLIEQELNEAGLGGVIVPLVADILDRERMHYIFERYRPQVIFHAAAHKHVYLMERQPAEAIRNNAVGTRRLAELAAEHGVEGFVLISTDKAINPTNVMGATKRLAELQLMALAATVEPVLADPPASPAAAAASSPSRAPFDRRPREHKGPTKFMAVRFGNVLGSSGSVIPIFKRQIANGGPVTVTHPEVTRYFMTIPEAVGLVLQSFVLGRGGEIFVLDMGQPVKIVDLARQMIELSGFRVGEDIEIVFSGLKPGEKLFEELQHHSEAYTPTSHPRIMRFTSRAAVVLDEVRALEGRLFQLDSNQLKGELKRLVPEYRPHLD